MWTHLLRKFSNKSDKQKTWESKWDILLSGSLSLSPCWHPAMCLYTKDLCSVVWLCKSSCGHVLLFLISKITLSYFYFGVAIVKMNSGSWYHKACGFLRHLCLFPNLLMDSLGILGICIKEDSPMAAASLSWYISRKYKIRVILCFFEIWQWNI